MRRDSGGRESGGVDVDGGAPVRALYKPWGEERYSSGSLPTSFKFTGQREEAALGLYFFNARWYDPSRKLFALVQHFVHSIP